MPDILICGMEMPKTCDKCKLRDRNVDAFIPFDKCFWTKRNIDPWTFGRKDGYPDDCPLHELPPHGDLIDRDALPKERVEWEDIVNAPVIVPSN